MQVQQCLIDATAAGIDGLAALTSEFAIRVTEHPTEPLVILNYDQIDSPRFHPITRECRGLVLDRRDWSVVARGFPRFFNAGEHREDDEKFDWFDFSIQSKEDGSLMLLYWWNNAWHVNTRGSFATGECGQGTSKTWEEVFCEAGIDEVAMDSLDPTYTYVFELCSLYNKVVRRYERPTLFLLTEVCNIFGVEVNRDAVDRDAQALRVKRPETFQMSGIEGICSFLEAHPDATFEGVVVRDCNDNRLKIKNKRYVALHHMRGEGDNLFSPKHLLPFIMKGEHSEVENYFPECSEALWGVSNQINFEKATMLASWDETKHIQDQKEFALAITQRTSLSSFLFTARKMGREPVEVFENGQQQLLRKFW
jgi:hypothetical protein